MYFVGIDLAWSRNNGTGLAVLEGDKDHAKLIEYNVRYTDEEIINFVSIICKNNNALISIDAPLIVPNEDGRRFCEAEIGRLFRKYNAGAYPSNRKIFNSFYGGIRGEELSKKLEYLGFKQNPYITQFEESRSFFEVYPHPSMVTLFNLEKILRYKAKPKRDYETRYNEFDKYIDKLSNLKDLTIKKNILQEDYRKYKSKRLKFFEDVLDGIFCSYISYYAWKNPEKCKVLGDMDNGYIMTPVFDYMNVVDKNNNPK